MPVYVPTVMYGLTLFIVVIQELHCLPKILHAYSLVVKDLYQFTKFRLLTLSSFLDM